MDDGLPAGDAAAPDAGEALIPAAAAPPAYRVLARKYRPQSFEDLIGQEPMVRTLSNAFETGRIPQAWMLTGVRGVGKTTTARILARALNYAVPGKVDRPTVDMPELGIHCPSIMESRHVDVIEMDAASHTGIADIREIIEASRYKPVSARYKVYIIDEVHMLSTSAFNGLLKTLEEPPDHVKFVFATTEIRKVPVTVLSRCQRFDLRRIDADMLVRHLAGIVAAEKAEADPEALALLARAAEGSVRDSLSLLDQALAHGGGRITAEAVRQMLGLADRARVVDLFEAAMRGDAAAALRELSEQHAVGADPAVVLADLAAFVHLVTRLKLVPEAADDASLTESERVRGAEFAATLPLPVMSRAWQILLKGIAEVQASARPLAAAEMVLVRLVYAADLPTPDEAIRLLKSGGPLPSGAGAPRPAPSGGGSAARALPRVVAETSAVARPSPMPEPVVAAGPALASLADVADLATERRDMKLKFAVERQLRPVRFEPGRIEVEPTPDASPGLAGDLGRRLSEWTGARWVVTVTRGGGGPTLYESRTETAARRRDDALADPLVAAVLARFPGAEVVDVRITVDDDLPPLEDMVPQGPDADDLPDDD